MCRWFNSAPGHHRCFRPPALRCAAAFRRVEARARYRRRHAPFINIAPRGAGRNLSADATATRRRIQRDERGRPGKKPLTIKVTAMSKTRGTGLLMVWSDVDADFEAEFNRWHDEEHIPRLLQVPGFLSAGHYAALKGARNTSPCTNSKITMCCAVPPTSTPSNISRRPPGDDRN